MEVQIHIGGHTHFSPDPKICSNLSGCKYCCNSIEAGVIIPKDSPNPAQNFCYFNSRSSGADCVNIHPVLRTVEDHLADDEVLWGETSFTARRRRRVWTEFAET